MHLNCIFIFIVSPTTSGRHCLSLPSNLVTRSCQHGRKVDRWYDNIHIGQHSIGQLRGFEFM